MRALSPGEERPDGRPGDEGIGTRTTDHGRDDSGCLVAGQPVRRAREGSHELGQPGGGEIGDHWLEARRALVGGERDRGSPKACHSERGQRIVEEFMNVTVGDRRKSNTRGGRWSCQGSSPSPSAIAFFDNLEGDIDDHVFLSPDVTSGTNTPEDLMSRDPIAFGCALGVQQE